VEPGSIAATRTDWPPCSGRSKVCRQSMGCDRHAHSAPTDLESPRKSDFSIWGGIKFAFFPKSPGPLCYLESTSFPIWQAFFWLFRPENRHNP
jgi:hypothetical protein